MKNEEDRKLVYLFFAILDYLREINDGMNLSCSYNRLEEIVEGNRKEVEYMPHDIRIAEAIQFFKDREIKAEPEWEESIALYNKEGHRCRPDFFVKNGKMILYGEVGGFSLEKIRLFYQEEQMIWISKRKYGWERNVFYFDKGMPYLRTLEEVLAYFLEKRRKSIVI